MTRLHVRHDGARFPEDLWFQETGDRSNFQGRYVVRHPFRGEASCDAMSDFVAGVAARREQEARNLSNLTGWSIASVRERMAPGALPAVVRPVSEPWWRRIWRR